MLFDEPLSSLDAKLRLELRREIRALHDSEGFTGVYVTHDQSEALAVASRIAVMNQGRVEQYAEPTAVYRRPATQWVASFMGVTNLIQLQRNGQGVWQMGDAPVSLGEIPELRGLRSVVLGFRPDAVILNKGDSLPERSDVRVHLPVGTVTETAFSGDEQEFRIDVGGHVVVGRQRNSWRGETLLSVEPSQRVQVDITRDDLLVYDEGGRHIPISDNEYSGVELSGGKR
jgi:ABC-type Fe3+/spermidine/putrescine transport system ATPase subunit